MRRSAVLFWSICASLMCANPSLTRSTTATSVTVLLDFEQLHSRASFDALRQELGRILKPARLKVDLRIKSEVPPSAQFGELVVFKMRGACTMNALPIGALSDERGALAMTYSVDGQLLPFGAVECDRVRESLQQVLGSGNPEEHQSAFGVALARVMAHEMYHMIGRCAAHTKDGITKESLSGRELAARALPLPANAANALRSGGNVCVR